MKRIVTLLLLIVAFATTAKAEVELRRQKNLATRVVVGIRDATSGALVTGAAGLDTECDTFSDGADPDGFADITDEAAEIGSTGMYQYSLTSGETNAEFIVCQTKSSTTDAMTAVVYINTTHGTILTNASGQLDTDTIPGTAYAARGTAQAVTGTTIQLASAEAFADDELNSNTAVTIVSATTGTGQTRCITDYVGSTDTATVATWTTTPTGTITYDLIPAPNCTATPSGTLDANVVSISGDTTAADNAELAFDGTGYAGGTTKQIVNLNPGTGTGQISLSSGAVTVGTNNDKTGYALTQTFPTNFASMGIAVGGQVTSNVTMWNGSNVLSPDISGAPKVTISAGTGTGQVALSSGAVTVGTNNDKTDYTLSTAGLGAFFTTDTTDVFADAVAGSIVKEIADNAGGGGGGLTEEDVRHALLDDTVGLGSFHDCPEGSYCYAAGDRAAQFLADTLAGTPGNDFVASDSPLNYNGNDYTDANFGVTGDYLFIASPDADPTGCAADNCRINGISGGTATDLDAILVTVDYSGGGGCTAGLHHTIIVGRGLLGDTCAEAQTGLEAALGGGGGGCTLDTVTCDNFKASYFSENGAADYTFNGFTGFENAGTVSVVSGHTTPATLTYDQQAPTYVPVDVKAWNGATVATPNTNGVPVVDMNSTTQTFDMVGDITGNLSGSIGSVGTDGISAASVAQSALSEFFTVDTGVTSGDAVDGSVVKETADLAGTGGISAEDVADAVWDEDLSTHTATGSTGEALSNATGGGGSSPIRLW